MGISNTSEKLNASALHIWFPLGIFEWVGLLVNRELSWQKNKLTLKKRLMKKGPMKKKFDLLYKVDLSLQKLKINSTFKLKANPSTLNKSWP